MLFHVTANADWSNLPLSGLFVDMLRRLVALSAGVAPTADNSVLAPAETLDGYGLLSPPPQAATGLPANEIARTPASPRHPPGLYGPENGRRALNLGTNLPLPEAASPVAGARIEDYANAVPERALGPSLLAAAVVLLALDLLIALGLRGLLRPSRIAAALVLGVLVTPAAQALDTNPNPALATRLGYIVTGDPPVGRRVAHRPGRVCRTTSTAAPPRHWRNRTRSTRARPTSASIRCSTGRSAPMRSRFPRNRRRR